MDNVTNILEEKRLAIFFSHAKNCCFFVLDDYVEEYIEMHRLLIVYIHMLKYINYSNHCPIIILHISQNSPEFQHVYP